MPARVSGESIAFHMEKRAANGCSLLFWVSDSPMISVPLTEF